MIRINNKAVIKSPEIRARYAQATMPSELGPKETGGISNGKSLTKLFNKPVKVIGNE
jgi:hypothetical protein